MAAPKKKIPPKKTKQMPMDEQDMPMNKGKGKKQMPPKKKGC